MPKVLNDRARDNARPLLAIADVAGGEWAERARKAIIELCSNHLETENSVVELIADICEIIESENLKIIFSRDLLNYLNELKGRPWGQFNGFQGIPLGNYLLYCAIWYSASDSKTRR